MWSAFWRWYERAYLFNVSVATGLFLLQVAHLVWLSADVVWARVFGTSLLPLDGTHQLLIALVDYTEIPALISVSFLYINELRQRWSFKDALYLIFLNTQWLHLFWITDEFVVSTFASTSAALPVWLAWVAIGIDYLELPVMYDTTRKFFSALKKA